MSVDTLFARIVEETDMWQSVYHGTNHWMSVRVNAMYLAENTGGDVAVAEYFSILHDCMRESEDSDPQHGQRASRYAEKHRGLIDLNDRQFSLLQRACAGHTFAMPGCRAYTDPTLAACWDGDRLDIGRVGETLDTRCLFSDLAKRLSQLGRIQIHGASYY